MLLQHRIKNVVEKNTRNRNSNIYLFYFVEKPLKIKLYFKLNDLK